MSDTGEGPPRRYVVGDVFAKGGVGAIHDTHDRALHRDLAYKVLLPNRAEAEQYRARFVREARLTAQLQHPNIVPVHDLGVDPEGNLFFTMKRVRGRTLEWILRALACDDTAVVEHFLLPRLLVMFGQMCQAVHYAHTRGVLHRDLKPANVMIGALGEVLVMDWGLAKRIPPLPSVGSDPFGPSPPTPAPPAAALEQLADDDTDRLQALLEEDLPSTADLVATIPAPIHFQGEISSPRLDQLPSDWSGSMDPSDDLLGAEGETAGIYETQDGRVLGTPAYMAPEQARGRELSVTADVYALGAILYEVLALRPAFRGSRAVKIMSAVARGTFEPPSHWARTDRLVDPMLERICLRAMAREPAARHATAYDLFLDIESFLQGTAERERREGAARAALAEAEEHRGAWTETRTALRRAIAETARLRSEQIAGEGLRAKRALWAAEDLQERLELDVERHRAALEESLRAALRELPDYGPARRALAEHAWDRLQEAELRGDHHDRVRYEAELRSIDDGSWTALLSAPSTLQLSVVPSDAVVTLAPVTEVDRRLRAGPAEPVACPARLRLEAGRYVITARSQGCAPVTVPIRAERGARSTLRLRLFDGHAVPDGFVHVPAGRARVGGDPGAHRCWPGIEVELPDFAMQVLPVTMADYLVFLRELESAEPGAGWARAPRNEPDGGQMLVRTADGELQLPEVDDGGHVWDPDLPVMAVSFEDAAAYAAWRTAREGIRFRLPTEAEWEFAARSPDGRLFPWGDRMVPDYALVLGTLPSAQPKPVGFAAADVNGFGIRDLGGGSRDWCDGWKTARKEMRVQRGGAWWDRPERSRLASRSGWPAKNVYGDSGFRLVVSLPPESDGPPLLEDPEDPRYGGIRDEHLPRY